MSDAFFRSLILRTVLVVVGSHFPGVVSHQNFRPKRVQKVREPGYILHVSDVEATLLNWDITESRINHAGRIRCESGWRLTEAWSRNLTDCDIWYVRGGLGAMTTMTRKIGLFPGVCLWMRPGGVYLGDQDPDHRLVVTYIHFELLSRASPLSPVLSGLPQELHFLNPTFAIPILDQIVDLVTRLDPSPVDIGHQRTAERLLDGLLMKLAYSPGSYDAEFATAGAAARTQKIRQLMYAIREDPSANWTVAGMAEALNVVPDHLSRLFKDVAGIGPRQFCISAKVDRAKKLLRDQNLPVWEVAELLGYSSCYYFSRQFKSVTGYTPSEIRRVSCR